MASFANRFSGTVRENITDPNDPQGYFWVDLKKTIPGAALDRLDATRYQAVSVPHTKPDGSIENVLETRIDLPAYRRELLVASIADWNLTDEFERPYPLKPEAQLRESVEQLPPAVYLQLLKVAQDLVNKSRAPLNVDDQSSFPENSDSGGTGE
jgi:hypothetical protein